MDRIRITIFTDPMMGLSYECQPVFDRLKETYGERIEITHVMAGLVRDVSDFMTPDEISYEPEEGIRRYCQRLAGIYKSEESIGCLPINMEGFHLFDAAHRSSYPLCIAYEAAFLKDLEYSRSLGIRGLPAYLIQTGERRMLVQSLIGYDEFIRIFGMLSK